MIGNPAPSPRAGNMHWARMGTAASELTRSITENRGSTDRSGGGGRPARAGRYRRPEGGFPLQPEHDPVAEPAHGAAQPARGVRARDAAHSRCARRLSDGGSAAHGGIPQGEPYDPGMAQAGAHDGGRAPALGRRTTATRERPRGEAGAGSRLRDAGPA